MVHLLNSLNYCVGLSEGVAWRNAAALEPGGSARAGGAHHPPAVHLTLGHLAVAIVAIRLRDCTMSLLSEGGEGSRSHVASSHGRVCNSSPPARLLRAPCPRPARSSQFIKPDAGPIWDGLAALSSGAQRRAAASCLRRGGGGDSAPGRRREVFPRKFFTNCRIMFLLQAYKIILSLVLLLCTNISRANSRRISQMREDSLCGVPRQCHVNTAL